MAKPLDCFLVDNLNGTAPAYAVEKGNRVFTIENGRPAEVQKPRSALNVWVKLQRMAEDELERYAWDLLLFVAKTSPEIEARDAPMLMAKDDIPFGSFVERDGVTIAMADSEYCARLVREGGATGLFIFNQKGVRLVKS